MKLIFLGSGSAFTVGNHNYQSNMLLDAGNEKTLLIDAGSDVRHSLHEQDYRHCDITDVYISHLHADHMGGLEWLGFTHKFDQKCKRPNLYLSEAIADDLWEHVLSGSMRSIEGKLTDLNSYFHVHKIPGNGGFTWEKIEFKIVQTVHIMNGYLLAPCHGLFFKVNGKNIYITADTQFCPHLLTVFYEEADMIFHDCETAPVHSNVHSHYTELVTLPDHIKEKIWLYHYNPGPLPDAEDDGFKGFVKKGQMFEL